MKNNRRQKHVTEILRNLLPLVPLSDFNEIKQKALAGHLRHLPPTIAARQAITSCIRHQHTDYDQLLSEGYDANSARHFVLEQMNETLEIWGSAIRLSQEDSAQE